MSLKTVSPITNQKTNSDTARSLFAIIASEQTRMWFFIALFCLGVFALAQPYPIYDDWSYGWSVKHLLESGELSYLATFATAVPVIFSGAIAAKIFGFSFQLMHNMTAFYNVVAALGLFYTLQLWKKDAGVASIAAGILLFNPILVNISFAFMTDAPAMACYTWVFWAFSKIIKKQDNNLIVATLILLSFLGILTRQSFAAVCPLLAIAGFATYKTNKANSLFVYACIPFQIALLVMADNYLLSHMQFSSESLRLKLAAARVIQEWLQQPLHFMLDAWIITGKVMAYLGPAALPIIVLRFPELLDSMCSSDKSPDLVFLRKTSWTSLLLALLVVAAPITYVSCVGNEWMPYFHAFWDFPRVGSYTWLSNEPIRSAAMTQYWTFGCSLIGTIGFWTLAYSLICAVRVAKISRNKEVLRFLLATMLSAAILLLLAFVQGKSINYDRYLVPLLVPFLMVTSIAQIPLSSNKNETKTEGNASREARTAGPSTLIAAFISTLLLGAYSFTAAIDFVNFQNARWKAALHMEAIGARVDELDVGPDYIFYKVPSSFSYCNPPTALCAWDKNPMNGEAPLGEVRRWPVLNEKYVLNPVFDYSLFVGFTPVYRVPFWSPWYWTEKEILVLMKDPLSTKKYVRPDWVQDIQNSIPHPGN